MTYDEQAKFDMAEWRKRGGFGMVHPRATIGCSARLTSTAIAARVKLLRALTGGQLSERALAEACGYSTAGSIYAITRRMVADGHISLIRLKKRESRAPGKFFDITSRGREWLEASQ